MYNLFELRDFQRYFQILLLCKFRNYLVHMAKIDLLDTRTFCLTQSKYSRIK